MALNQAGPFDLIWPKFHNETYQGLAYHFRTTLFCYDSIEHLINGKAGKDMKMLVNARVCVCWIK